jgi:CRP-like cAMP-binding protein
LLLTHLLAVIGEWAATVGLLVHAHDWGGSRAVGVASIALLLPSLAAAPLVAAAMGRWRTHAVRVTTLVIQSLSYGAAAVSAAVGAPTPIVAVFVVVGVAGVSAVPPTSAALLPRLARTTDDLIGANLWMTHCDSSSALVGSLAAGLVVSLGGPEAVFAAGAIGTGAGLAATMWRPGRLARSATGRRDVRPRRLLRRTLIELRTHPWSVGVLCIASARNLIVGSFDVLLVIVAIDVLDLGGGGAGYLGALVGAGALASTLVTTAAVRRATLRPALLAAITTAAVLSMLLGLYTERTVVFIALPLVGLCMASMDALSRTLLQRSTDPRNLGPLYAALGVVAGIGQLGGSVLAQGTVALADPEVALVVLGALLLALAGIGVGSLRRADDHADVPSVEMALLAGLPMLSPLPTAGLEAVARSAETIAVDAGQAIVREGERVEACFVVAAGEFQITAKGTRVRTASRGDAIGEVALLTSITSSTSVTAISRGSVVRIGRHPFLVALTGHDVDGSGDTIDYESARHRFREVVAMHQRDTRSGDTTRLDSWLGLAAAGRMLGDPSYTAAIARGASLARAAGNGMLLAEAAAMTTWPGAFFFIAEHPDHEMIEICEAALAVLPRHDPMRVRVLATLASNLTFADGPERRRAVIAEAHTAALGHGDPALTGAVLNAEFICLWEPGTLDRREEIADQLVHIAARTGDHELAYIGGFFVAYCAAERGRLRQAREHLTVIRELLPATRNQYFEFLGDRLTLSIDIALGEPDAQARIDALAARHAATHADTDGTWALQVGGLAYQTGTLHTMVPAISTMLGGPHARTWRAALALAHLMAGDTTAAATAIDEQGDVPRSYFWITVAQVQAEVAAALGLTERCATLFDDLYPFRGRVGITASGSLCFGLVSRSLGELALALGRVDHACQLLTDAVTSADEIGMRFESVAARRLLASALRARGERERAASVAGDALLAARDRGYLREARLLGDLVGR